MNTKIKMGVTIGVVLIVTIIVMGGLFLLRNNTQEVENKSLSPNLNTLPVENNHPSQASNLDTSSTANETPSDKSIYGANTLFIDIAGSSVPLLTNPSSQRQGSFLGTIFREIKNAEMEFGDGSGDITIPTPLSGTYHLDLTGNIARDLKVHIIYVDTSGVFTEEKLMVYTHSDTASIAFTLSPGTKNPIILNPSIKTPTNIVLSISGSSFILKWDSISDANSYRIYRYYKGLPYWEYVADTKVTNYTDTSAPANTSIRYAISAVKVDGSRSFMSNPIRSD